MPVGHASLWICSFRAFNLQLRSLVQTFVSNLKLDRTSKIWWTDVVNLKLSAAVRIKPKRQTGRYEQRLKMEQVDISLQEESW
jgi:hypothetical protein